MLRRLPVLALALWGCQDIREVEEDDASAFGGQIGPNIFGMGGEGGSPPDGQGGTAGQGGGGGTPSGDARGIPQQGAGCDGSLQISAQLASQGPFLRSQEVKIDFQVNGAYDAIHWDGPEGAMTIRETAVFFHARGSARWTDNYDLTLAAVRSGCVGSTTVALPLYGDLLAGDNAGVVHFVANDGSYLGVFKTVADSQKVRAIVARRAQGTLIVAVDGASGADAEIIEIDQRGNEVRRYEMSDRAQEPLYEGNGPRNLLWDANAGLLFGDNRGEGFVTVWNGQGHFITSAQLPTAGTTLGAAYAGVPVFGVGSKLYKLNGGPEDFEPEILINLPENIVGFGTSQGGGVVAVTGRDSAMWHDVTVNGRETGTGRLPAGYPAKLMPLGPFYLGVGNAFGAYLYPADFGGAEGFLSGDARSLNDQGGFVWLN